MGVRLFALINPHLVTVFEVVRRLTSICSVDMSHDSHFNPERGMLTPKSYNSRAMFPGWENRVYDARIDVWCVDDLTEG